MRFNIHIDIDDNDLFIANESSSGCQYNVKNKEELIERISNYVLDLIANEQQFYSENQKKEERALPVLGKREVFEPIKGNYLLIKKIDFIETIPNLDDVEDKWDVSDKQDGSIMAWMDNDTLYISGNGTILANENCEELFSGLKYIDLIQFNGLLDTSNIKNANYMFAWCKNLDNLDISKWNTQKLENAWGMFGGCEKLKSVDVSKWNTENLQNVEQMFGGCISLEKIDISNWDTRSLKNACFMFAWCTNLEKVDVSNWNTQKFIDTWGIFLRCENLEEVISNDSYILEEFEELKEKQKADSYSL